MFFYEQFLGNPNKRKTRDHQQQTKQNARLPQQQTKQNARLPQQQQTKQTKQNARGLWGSAQLPQQQQTKQNARGLWGRAQLPQQQQTKQNARGRERSPRQISPKTNKSNKSICQKMTIATPRCLCGATVANCVIEKCEKSLPNSRITIEEWRKSCLLENNDYCRNQTQQNESCSIIYDDALIKAYNRGTLRRPP